MAASDDSPPAPACWCGATAASPLRPLIAPDGRRFTRVRCDGCAVERLEPQPSEADLELAYGADYYGAPRRKFVSWIARLVTLAQRLRARSAARRLFAGARVLDIGCGNGGFLAAMAARGFRVEGTERDAGSAARAKSGRDFAVHAGDLTALPLTTGTYDLVTLWHVLEHLRDPAATLTRIHELMVPGGLLVLSLPNAESWQARCFGPHWFHHDPPRHLFSFGRLGLTRLLAARGFTVLATSTWSLEQNVFGLVQSALNAIGLPRDRAFGMLKGQRLSIGIRCLDFTLVTVLTPAALLVALVEACWGRGGTMTVLGRANPDSAAGDPGR
jgi:SAM-dependent methyltransferase